MINEINCSHLQKCTQDEMKFLKSESHVYMCISEEKFFSILPCSNNIWHIWPPRDHLSP